MRLELEVLLRMAGNHHDNTLYALQARKDNMNRNWPETIHHGKVLCWPSEEFLRIQDGYDAGLALLLL